MWKRRAAVGRVQLLIKTASDHYSADIILYVGPIDRTHDDDFITRVKNWKRRPNAILILTTLGGDPHAVYRMARCLQEEYKTVVSEGVGPPSQKKADGKFRLFVDAKCNRRRTCR